MSLPFDSQADFAQVVDGHETLTLRRAGGAEVVLPGAVAASIVVREEGWPGSAAVSQEVTWEFALPENESPPQVGDSLRTPGDAWRVEEVELPRAGSYVRCRASMTRITSTLVNRVDIEEAILQSSGGVGWRTVRAAAPASFQLLETTADHSTTPVTSSSAYRVLLEDTPPLDHRHRLRTPDGRVFQVDKYRSPADANALPEAEATLVADGDS